ncbi:hypothetical protein [Pseudochrobactrum asaccharolyticum]|uniref:Uncharacterized protein n=1 Tax=Pseudochrobactrum asaccharolyticum TaxID=354351 RepID=A0A366DKB6_9HYPH|nr:hypothetical protein [Pseudochrobactrum asaccharolyticum]RBO90520.1 hypothetical protein DFR47_11381 [Pseudochrobactrum asaccharolyticum]
MKIHEVFSVSADVDEALLIDMDYSGLEGRTRAIVAYRESDPYSPLTPLITQWLADNNPEILPYIPPEPEPEQPISIPAVTFWERTTEAEGTAIETMLNQQPFRVRQIFMTAQSYRSDHELWPLLQSAAIGLFGEERAAELLAQP